MILQITEDHIARGMRHNPYDCPVALALKQMYPWADVSVLPHFARMITPHRTWFIIFDPELREWIGRYDRRLAADPGTFIVTVRDDPPPGHNLIDLV
jgi:hypothetical protein